MGRNKQNNQIDDDLNGFIDDVNGWDFSKDSPEIHDQHGHGTHVAGIISKVANHDSRFNQNACDAVRVMSLQYYDPRGDMYNLANTIRAIHYAVNNGAQIINYSGGGNSPAYQEKEAVRSAMEAGILFMAAAGNEGRDIGRSPYYPAAYGFDNLIAVASLDIRQQLLPSSDWGRPVQLAAPGLRILSTLPGGYGTLSGTSMAAPFVTGAAGYLMAHFPGLSWQKVKDLLIDTGVSKQALLGARALRIDRAVEKASR